ncbi:MAG: type 1 glutamine amidotransferase [Pseudomonadota bacterium]
MNIAILDLCSPDPIFDSHGTASELSANWLGPHLPEAALTRIVISGGAPLPAVEEYDGYVLTGSEKGVYDDTPWMEPLKAFLRDLKAACRPVYGICFGHQVMAEAYGGKAEKADKGMVVGALKFDTCDGSVNAIAMHQDQVTGVPPGARVTASAAYCPVAALAYDFPALSTQFHPEYTPGLVDDALVAFEGHLLSSAEADAARKTMAIDVPEDLYVAEVADFFRRNVTSGT